MDSVVHFEIPSEDMERAKEFYKKLFGWQMEDMPDMNYVITRTCEVDENKMPKNPGAINGGFYKRDNSGAATGPVLVINVENLDESIEKIKESGGSIVREKVQVGDMGLYAQFKDPEGNILGLWQNLKF